MSILGRALWREVRGRPVQFGSVGLVIALGVALFCASYDAYLNLADSYQQLYRETSFAHVTAVGGPTRAILAAGEALPDLEAAISRTTADVPFRPLPDRTLIGRVVGLPANGHAAVDDILITEGRTLDPSIPDGVVVEQHMADHFGLGPGDSFEISTAQGWQTVRVLGVAVSPEYLWPAKSRQEVLVLPDDFGVVFAPESFVAGLPPSAQRHEVLYRLTEPASGTDIEQARQAALAAGALDAFTLAEQPSNAALQEDVSGFAEMSVMFPLFFLIAAAFATYVMLGRMIAGQQANIGTLRASGLRRRTIVGHYTAIGTGLGVVGALAGALLGAVLAAAITELYTGTLGIPAAVVSVRLSTVAMGFLTGVITGTLAAWLPARAAGRIAPAMAMRGQLPPGGGGRSLFERLIPPVRRLPVRWLSAVRSLGRARRRSVASIVGVVLATMLVLVSWGFIDSITVLLDRQFVQIDRADAELHIGGRPADAVAADVAKVDGVLAVELALQVPVSVSGPDGSYATTLTALQPGSDMHRLLGSDGTVLPVPSDGVVLGQAMAGRLGVGVGDAVQLSVAGLLSVPEVPVTGFVSEPMGTFAYTSLPAVDAAISASGMTDVPSANTILLTFDPGIDRAAMRTALTGVDGVQAYVDSKALYDLAQQFMGLFYAFVGVMIVLGGVLAFALIYNTMSANIAERQGELAVLRTLGLSRRAIGAMVTAQNLLLTVIGLVPGLLLGWLLAWVFMQEFSSDMFDFSLTIEPRTFVLTALAVVVVGLLSQWPALRAVGRLDLGSIVRDRSL